MMCRDSLFVILQFFLTFDTGQLGSNYDVIMFLIY